MTPKQSLRLVFALLAATATVPAIAGPKDAAALKKIDEAVNVHYIAAEFDKAESVLLAAIKTCGAKGCSGEVIAKAYVYVGVIRGNSKSDLTGAREAFQNAQAADPNVTLDSTLVTPAVLAEFNKVMGNAPDTGAPKVENLDADQNGSDEPKKAANLPRVAPVGELRCSPATGYEIQKARPVPIQCERMENVVRGELYYKPVGAEEYTAVLMRFNSTNATLRAEIPCDALAKKGTLEMYVVGQDENKDIVDTFGNLQSPVEYQIVDKTKSAPPSFPGEAAPKRCTDLSFEDSPGAAPGESCTEDKRCRKGLYCSSGVCRKTPTCETNAECESDKCVEGLCAMEEDYSDKSKFKRFMVGLNIAQDLWLSSASSNVCGAAKAANGDYNCYNEGSSHINVSSNPALTNYVPSQAYSSGNVKTTLLPATTRILASLDYALTPVISVGTRLGLAINTPPPTIHYAGGAPSQNKNFFAPHVELRANYWFVPLDQPGFHPYVGVSAGAAEVDAKVTVTAYYIPQSGDTCQKYGGKYCAKKLDAWRKMGQGFAGLNFGGLMKFGSRHNVVLNVNALYMLPSTGIVLEPSLGYLFGF